MTREEAVIILDGFKNNPLFNDTHAQAFDMAISALSAEGDLISRQAVFNIIEREQFKGDAISEIEKLPSAENKGEDRPKGHWIYWSGSPFRWECDKCGGLFKTDFNFCPNCGADMRGEK